MTIRYASRGSVRKLFFGDRERGGIAVSVAVDVIVAVAPQNASAVRRPAGRIPRHCRFTDAKRSNIGRDTDSVVYGAGMDDHQGRC